MLRLLVERYFHLGFKNQVILDFLKNCHGIRTSLSTLKRWLRDYVAHRLSIKNSGKYCCVKFLGLGSFEGTEQCG